MTNVNMELSYIGGTNLDGWECNEWSVTLEYNGREMETEYYTGVAISEPNVDDVLNSLIIDSRASDYNFEDWADEFGYDTDSRKAEQIYNNCLEIGKKVNNLLGDDKIDFEEKYENY